MVCAVVVSPTLDDAAGTAQRDAATAGVRIGVFADIDRARAWLAAYLI